MYVCRIGRSIWFDCNRIVMLFAVYNPHYYPNRIIAMIFVKHESRAVSSFNTHTQTADWLITSIRSHPNIYEYAFVLPHFSKPLPEFNVLVSWFHISNSNSFFGRSILLFSFSIPFFFAFVSLSLSGSFCDRDSCCWMDVDVPYIVIFICWRVTFMIVKCLVLFVSRVFRLSKIPMRT